MPIGKTLASAGRSASVPSPPASAPTDQVVLQGWLIKSPPEKTLWRHKWKKTWFVLRAGNYPGQYLLEYFKQKSDKKPRGSIDLSQCEQVDAGLVFESRKVDFPFIFDIKTKDRTYYLVTQTEEEMNEWVKNICSLCGFKVKDEGDQSGHSEPTNTRPASTPSGIPRRPPSEPLVNLNNNNNNDNSHAPVNSHTLSHGHHLHHHSSHPHSNFHHHHQTAPSAAAAAAARRASSPTTASTASRSRHVSNASAASTVFSSVCSDLNGIPSSRNELSPRHPLPPPVGDEDEERGSYIPLIECVSGRQGSVDAAANQSISQAIDPSVKRPPMTSNTWHPAQLPRPTLPRLGGHNPLWYDVPSSIDVGDATSASASTDDQLYKDAPTGRGSIVDTWYQSPKSTEADTNGGGAASQKLGKKPLPPPPPQQQQHQTHSGDPSPTNFGQSAQLTYDFPSHQRSASNPTTAPINGQQQQPQQQHRHSPAEERQQQHQQQRESPSADSVDGSMGPPPSYDAVVRPPRPPKPSHLQSPSPLSLAADPNFTQYDFPPPIHRTLTAAAAGAAGAAAGASSTPPATPAPFTSLTVPRNTTYRGQNDGDSTSMTGSTGSVQPSPRFDRRDHGSLQNLPGGVGGVSVGGFVGSSASTMAPLRSPMTTAFGGPTKTSSFPTELYDTPSNHQLAPIGKNSTVAAESWYSSPASHRQDGVVVESSGATAATPKKTSPVGWTPAVKGAQTGKASPAKLAQDNWTDFPGNTPPRIDRDLKPRRPSTDCATPSPSRSPVGHIGGSGNGTRSGQGSIDSITDIESNNVLHLPVATKRTQSFQRADRSTPVKTLNNGSNSSNNNNAGSSSTPGEVALPSRRPMNPVEDDDSSSDEREGFSHHDDAVGGGNGAGSGVCSSSSRGSSIASPLKTPLPLSSSIGGFKTPSSGISSSNRVEYSLDQKIPAPDPSQFLPTGAVEYIEVDPEMSSSTTTTSTTASHGFGGGVGGGGGGGGGGEFEDTVSIISTVEPTHYTPIDFHRTKGLIESKRENANEREKLLAS